jgi:prepilin-type processing-associated H-X9-DG protein
MAKAVTTYESTKQSLPGWRNVLIGASGIAYPSWPVMLLPQLERADVYRIWEAGAVPTDPPAMSIFICPTSSAEPTGAPLTYAANGGTGLLNGTNQIKGDGVFLDSVGNVPGTTTYVSGTTSYAAAKINLDLISTGDGATNTLLFSEKCSSLVPAPNTWNAQAGPYAGNEAAMFDCSTSGTAPSLFGIANNVTTTIAAGKIVNCPTLLPDTRPLSDFSVLAQPSSNHPGGVVAAFADGHTVFLKDSVRSYVYANLLTSNSIYTSGSYATNSSRLGGTTTATGWLRVGVDPAKQPYLLQESDY